MKNRVFIFVDGENVFHAQKSMRWRLDYRKLNDWCEQFGEVVGAHFYMSVKEDGGDIDRVKAFKNVLRVNRFNVIEKRAREMCNECGDKYYKANIDIPMAVGIIQEKERDNFDTAIIMTGDGDFSCVIENLRAAGKGVKVLSPRDNTSHCLLDVVGRDYYDLNDIKDRLEMTYGNSSRCEDLPPARVVG